MDDPSRHPPSDAERWNAPRHHRPRADRGALSDRDAGQDGGARPDPAVVADRDGPRVHDAVAAGLDVLVVALGEDGHVRRDEDAVPDGDEAAVVDAQTVCRFISC